MRKYTVVWMLGLLLGTPAAQAQAVVLSGLLGQSKALLVIDGQPQTLSLGASAKGVTLKRIGATDADIEVGGRITTLHMGGAPARLSGTMAAQGGNEIVLAAGPGGHFMSAGTINGKGVRFMVDTGATTIALSQAEAQRVGLDYLEAPRALSHTAGGTVVVYQVTLAAVRVGEVEVFNVPAVVLAADMPFVLLGNSFLGRFSMQRDNDVMRLRKK